jgi:putative PIN family toxin of toxin-antitoxin system
MPAKPKHRVIIDTNLWISFLLTNEYSQIDTMFADNNLTLIFSQELIDEFIEVAQRPKFRKYFSLNDIEDLLQRVRRVATFISVTTTFDRCRDPKDNFLLALAQDGKATHLLTGDKDLLVLGTVGKTKILTIADYIKKNSKSR